MRGLVWVGSLFLASLTSSIVASEASAVALRTGFGGPAGYGTGTVGPTDDGSSSAIDLTVAFGPQGLNYFGTNKTQVFVNNNGNITFDGSTGQYTPTGISAASNPIIAAFFADVDTNMGGTVYFQADAATKTFVATWDNVGYFRAHNDKTNSFQIVLLGQPTPGDFDIEIRYASLQFTTGDASGGTNGLGGTPARAGYSAGNSMTFFEFPESGDQNAMLDLVNRSNVGTAGLFIFRVRNGGITPPPTFTSTVTPTITPSPSSTPTPTPASNCCAAHNGAGCDDNACQACVCALDPFCCDALAGDWDDTCAGKTTDPEMCGLQCLCTGVTCTVSPPSATNPVGTRHDLTVELTQSGKAVAGADVHTEVTSGPNAGLFVDLITGADGRVFPSYIAGTMPGVDVIGASGMIERQAFACTATKEWLLPECTIDPP